jgi:hypothetical protein
MAVGQKAMERNLCPGALPQGYDEYRRWRINHEGGKGAWHLMSGNKTLFQRNLRRRIRAFARLEVLD